MKFAAPLIKIQHAKVAYRPFIRTNQTFSLSRHKHKKQMANDSRIRNLKNYKLKMIKPTFHHKKYPIPYSFTW